ncbi:MAG: hypothetical protein MR727_13205 [Lentisphaeria bacterium]|nr:hypothetical protein [Lentisphaeria bacterium]
MAQYEDFIRFGVRKAHTVPGWTPDEVQIIEYQGKSVLFLMNSGRKPKPYQGKTVAPGGVLVQPI